MRVKNFQLATLLLINILCVNSVYSGTDVYSVSKPETPIAMAILSAPKDGPNGPVFSGSSGSLMLEIPSDKSYLDGKLILSKFGSPVERIDIHLGHSGSNGPLVFVIPLTAAPGQEQLFRLDETDFCPPRLCNIEELRNSGVSTLAQAIGNIQVGRAYIEVHTGIRSDGELVGDISVHPPTSASISCHPWGCACGGYDSCNSLIAACAAGGSWRCLEYNEWGGCELGACVTLETDDMDKMAP